MFIPNVFDSDNYCFPDSVLAVMLFFVMSGFLITYLLTVEHDQKGHISLKNYYLRRALRIFPLYYLIIILSYFIVKEKVSFTTGILSLTLFPNIAMAIKQPWANSPQIWTIGVEEQFYLLWPLILTYIPDSKKIKYFIIYCISHYLFVKFVAIIVHNFRILEDESITRSIQNSILATRYHFLAIGSILGFMYAKKHNLINVLLQNYIAYPSILLSFLFLFLGRNLFGASNYLADEFYVILFGISILNFATNENLKFNLESSILNFLGKISYGIYMYHWIVIVIVTKFIRYSGENSSIVYNFKIYLLVITITILLSWFSYTFFERHFLKLKNKKFN